MEEKSLNVRLNTVISPADEEAVKTVHSPTGRPENRTESQGHAAEAADSSRHARKNP